MDRTPRWFRLFSVILALVVLLPQGILAAGSAPQGPVIQTGHYLYLPLVLKGFTGPNLPVPNLAAIDNADHDGSYTLSWTEAPVRLADWYLMQAVSYTHLR